MTLFWKWDLNRGISDEMLRQAEENLPFAVEEFAVEELGTGEAEAAGLAAAEAAAAGKPETGEAEAAGLAAAEAAAAGKKGTREPAAADSMNLGICGCRISIRHERGAVYGLGERFDRVNQDGCHVTTQVVEKFCYQGKDSYCPVPFFFTDNGLGVYVDTLTVTDFDFSETIRLHIRADSAGRLPAMVFFGGSPAEILKAFSEMTGKPVPAPKWSFGPWMSANRWNTQEEALRQLELAQKYRIPHTVMVLEAWSDEATFYRFNGGGKWKDPEGLVRRLKGEGIRLILWQIPVLKRMDRDEPQEVLDEDKRYALEHGLCLKNPDGTAYTIPEDHWFAGSYLPDFTNPETARWWFSKRQYLLDMGVAGFKTDGGEFVLTDDVRAANGMTGLELKNGYVSFYLKAYADFAKENRVLFSRAGYTGQQQYPMQWAGDQASTWEEFRHVLTAGISAGLSGIPYWGFDIGGFAGPMPEAELYERAVQCAVFAPVMQWHSEPVGGQFADCFPATDGQNDRSPWNVARFYGDEEMVDRLRWHFNLRMNLLPYLYQQAVLSSRTGLPMMKHLLLEYPQDKSAWTADDCFMLGDLLVAPILEKGQAVRSVYLPQGGWNCLWPMKVKRAGESDFHEVVRISGGTRCEVACDPDRIPVFARDGACIALNLDETHQLGSDVGNETDTYHELCFYLAGEEGNAVFSDDLGNEISVRWKDGGQEVTRLAGEQPYTILRARQ